MEENGTARWVRWVTRMAGGDVDGAERDIGLASDKVRSDVLWGLVAFGWLCIGDEERALEVLRKCRREGKEAAIIDRDLAVFVRTNERLIAEGKDES